MSIKIKFDSENQVVKPDLILMTKGGRRIGVLNDTELHVSVPMNGASEISFTVNKEGCAIWDEITDMRVVWCKDWNRCYEISLDINETTEIKKVVRGTALAETELSNLRVYGTYINNDADIARDDGQSVLYNPGDPENSILHRVLQKAMPLYRIGHVDDTLKLIQRTFEFNDKSIYDCLQEIAEECQCLFVFDSGLDSNFKYKREINVYDLLSYCNHCHTRGEYTNVCTECGSTDITPGYGEDTTIFISSDNLADDITFTTDVPSVKNCFKLEAGDDLMTATVVNCSPGGGYIFYFTDEMLADMSDTARTEYQRYRTALANLDKTRMIENSELTEYNEIVNLYNEYIQYMHAEDTFGEKDTLEDIIGYEKLMKAYYDTVDMNLFLTSEFMPDSTLPETTAAEQAETLLNSISRVSVHSSAGSFKLSNVSKQTVESSLLSMAKAYVDSRYDVSITEGSYDTKTFKYSGTILIENRAKKESEDESADKDTAECIFTGDHNLTVDDDYENYIKEKIQVVLKKQEKNIYGIVGLVTSEPDEFEENIRFYSLHSLYSVRDALQACIDLFIEQGSQNGDATWNPDVKELYDEYIYRLYGKYKQDGKEERHGITQEIDLKTAQLEVIDALTAKILNKKHDVDDDVAIAISEIAPYLREDTYRNQNYVSDGKSNLELFEKASEFIVQAKREIFRAATKQHSITASLNNLLVMPEFAPLVQYFDAGNWLHIRVDGRVYKLRLIEYAISFDDLQKVDVEFSDVMTDSSQIGDIKQILSQASSMAASFDSVQRQSLQGVKAQRSVSELVEDGLNTTNIKIISGASNQVQSWDDNGMLFREYDDLTDSYGRCQLKIVNSTLAITDDNWRTLKTAIGKYYYTDDSGNLICTYGIIGDTLIGKLIIGERMRLSNNTQTLIWDNRGLLVFNSNNSVVIDPDSSTIFSIKKRTSGATDPTKGVDMLSMDASGNLVVKGEITATSGYIGAWRILSESANKTGYGYAPDALYGTVSEGTKVNILFSPDGTKNYFYAVDQSDKLSGWLMLMGRKSSGGGFNFGVYKDGSLYATGAHISGEITATNLKLGTNAKSDLITAGFQTDATISEKYVKQSEYNTYLDKAIDSGYFAETVHPNLLRNTDNPKTKAYLLKRSSYLSEDSKILSGYDSSGVKYAAPYDSCFYVPNHLSTTTGKDAQNRYIYTSYMDISGAATYTLSFRYRFSGTITNRVVRIILQEIDAEDKRTSTIYTISASNNSWRLGRWTFATLSTTVKAYFRFEGIGDTISSESSNLRVNYIKCEQGDYPTAYTRYGEAPATLYAPNILVSNPKYTSAGTEYVTVTAVIDDEGTTEEYNVNTDGLLVAENAVVKGTIIATNGIFTGSLKSPTGDIGGWTIASKYLVYSKKGQSDFMFLYPGGSVAAYEIGDSGNKAGWRMVAGSTFGIDVDNVLYATGVHISGEITATSLNLSNAAAKKSVTDAVGAAGYQTASQVNTTLKPYAKTTAVTAVSDALADYKTTVSNTYATNAGLTKLTNDALLKGEIVSSDRANLLKNTDNPTDTTDLASSKTYVDLTSSLRSPYKSCFYAAFHASNVAADADSNQCIYTSYASVKPSTIYTLSFDYKGSGTNTNPVIRVIWRWYGGSNTSGISVTDLPTINVTKDGEWHRASITIKTTDTAERGYWRFEGVADAGSTISGGIRINYVKFEAGTNATQYTRYDLNSLTVYSSNLDISAPFTEDGIKRVKVTDTDSGVEYTIPYEGASVMDNAVIKGTIIATNGIFTGSLQSPTGNIGGWTINTSKLAATVDGKVTAVQAGGTWAFAAGGASHSNYSDCPFRVDHAGNLIASQATITGKITAESGTIGKWSISTTTSANTTAKGGHAYQNSIYCHTSDSTYEYEVGMAAYPNSASASNYAAIYVGRITKGNKWDVSTSPGVSAMFYVRNDGYMYAAKGNIGGVSISDGTSNSLYTTYIMQTKKSTGSAYTSKSYSLGFGGIDSKYDSPSTTADDKIDIYAAYNHADSCGIRLYLAGSLTTYLTPPLSKFNNAIISDLYATGLGGTSRMHGTWKADSAISVSSDVNRKNTISDLSERYSILFDNLRPVTYKYNDGTSGRLHTGFIANDVEDALNVAQIDTSDFAGLIISHETDEETGETTESYYLRYEEFIALNTKEIQKLKQKVSALEAEINLLKGTTG